ncbi:MAG: GNAT family N-acetyltransferase [Bacteroidota bacterium]
MSTALIIKKASSASISDIRRIAQETWPVAYGELLSKEQLDYMMHLMYSETALQEQMNKGHQFFMAEIGENVFGFASVSDEGGGKFKLNKLYVIPITQKTGAGKALLEKTIEFAKQNGGTKLFLQVKRDNIARGFYEKQGFTITGELDLDIGNGYFMNDYIMELSL